MPQGWKSLKGWKWVFRLWWQNSIPIKNCAEHISRERAGGKIWQRERSPWESWGEPQRILQSKSGEIILRNILHCGFPGTASALPLISAEAQGFLSLLRWPGCHEAMSCFGALLLLTHLPQHYNSPCPCPPLSHWVNSRVSCKPRESPASSKDVTSCSNIWMSSPSLILLHALYVYRIAF